MIHRKAPRFMIGSMFFAIAAFLNAMDIHKTHPQFKQYAFTIASSYEFGGLLFVGGTMGYVSGKETIANLGSRNLIAFCQIWQHFAIH